MFLFRSPSTVRAVLSLPIATFLFPLPVGCSRGLPLRMTPGVPYGRRHVVETGREVLVGVAEDCAGRVADADPRVLVAVTGTGDGGAEHVHTFTAISGVPTVTAWFSAPSCRVPVVVAQHGGRSVSGAQTPVVVAVTRWAGRHRATSTPEQVAEKVDPGVPTVMPWLTRPAATLLLSFPNTVAAVLPRPRPMLLLSFPVGSRSRVASQCNVVHRNATACRKASMPGFRPSPPG